MAPGPTPALQLACLGIVLLYVGLRLRRADRVDFAVRFAQLVGASWLAEDTAIRLYGFYHYDPGWWPFVDRVPLLIVLIWPVVIHSAYDLVERWLPRLTASRMAVVSGLVILTDAALIEPIAVHCGLWSWTEPGLFGVPPIGVLGWAFFTGLAVWVWRVPIHRAWVLLLAPLGTHVLLLATWWGLLRHLNGEVDPRLAVTALGIVAAMLSMRIARTRRAPPLGDVWMRGPGAIFFFVLLALFARDHTLLVFWTVAFALPWVTLVLMASRARRG